MKSIFRGVPPGAPLVSALFPYFYIASLAYPLPYCQAIKFPVAGGMGTTLYCKRRLSMVELVDNAQATITNDQ